MIRVIAGLAGGRRLGVPPGTGTRPTSDRAREGLFASVLSELGDLHGKRVLDLYAGSGALGLEALSRGAGSVLLVESDARAAAVIKANIAAIALPGASVATDRVERLLLSPGGADFPHGGQSPRMGGSRPPSPPAPPIPTGPRTPGTPQDTGGRAPGDDGRYDLAFADPPYAMTEAAVTRVLTLLAGGWLADDALVVIERATRSGPLDWPPGYLPEKSRRYGEATFWYGWYGSGAEAGQPQETVSQPALDAPHKAHEE